MSELESTVSTISSGKLRAAVIGVGYLGRFHAQKYASLKEDIELVGVCDSYGDQAKKVAAEVGVAPFTRASDLIGKIDIATIAVPTSRHYEVARELLDAGIHLLIEKPITAELRHAEELASLATHKRVIIQVGHIERFNPAFVSLRKAVATADYFEASRLAPFKPRALDVDVVTDLMIHDIDLMLNMIPEPITKIEAQGASVMTNTIDVAHANFLFASGRKAHISVNRCYPHAVRSVSVYNDRQHFFADLQNATVSVVSRKVADVFGPQPAELSTIAVEKKDAMLEETMAFIQAVRGKAVAAVPARDGIEAMRVMERVIGVIRG